MGWRYFNFTLGALTILMFACRFFLFHLYESPKFLLSRGRQAEAVAAVHGVAYKNRRRTWLTEEILNEIGGDSRESADKGLSRGEVIKRFFGKFSTERIAPLFATRRLGTMSKFLYFSLVIYFDRTEGIWCPRGRTLSYPTYISNCQFAGLTKRVVNADILRSMPHLVLLGHDRNGLSTLQRVSSPVSQELGARHANAHQYSLSQLRHHVGSGHTWIHDRILYGR